MPDSPADDDFFAPGSPFAFVYGAMLGATIAGQMLGIGLDALVGVRTAVVPAACSVALEAFAAARLGARIEGHALETRRAAVVSATYTAALVAVSAPIAAWFAVARTVSAPGVGFTWTALRVAVVLLALGATIPARWGLIVLFSRRPS